MFHNTLPQGVLQVRWLLWRMCLYSGQFEKVILLQECIFQAGGLVFDKEDLNLVKEQDLRRGELLENYIAKALYKQNNKRFEENT